jgi:hypothetical protein
MTAEEERWAEAIALERMYGDNAPLYIAERVGAAALAGDEEGLQRWKAIAARLDALRSGRGNV